MNTILALLMLLTPDDLQNPTLKVVGTFDNLHDCEEAVKSVPDPKLRSVLKCFVMAYNKTEPLDNKKSSYPACDTSKISGTRTRKCVEI